MKTILSLVLFTLLAPLAHAEVYVTVPATVIDFDEKMVILELESGARARVERTQAALRGKLRPQQLVEAVVPLRYVAKKIKFLKE